MIYVQWDGDKVIENLIRNVSHTLTSFSLLGSKSDFIFQLKGAKQIRILNINGSVEDKEGLCKVVETLENLEELKLLNGAEQILNHFSTFKKFPKLKNLTILFDQSHLDLLTEENHSLRSLKLKNDIKDLNGKQIGDIL